MRTLSLAAFSLAALLSVTANAETPEQKITIKDHVFTPSALEIPAGEKVKLIIDNQDATAEEFESSDLKREKVIPANSSGVVFVGPLKPGTYKFVGEFHEKTAQGVITVK